MSQDSRRFEMTIDIAAPRDAVWKALAEDAELARWFAPEARITPGEGGEVTWAWGERDRWPQRVETWQPGSRLKTRYDSRVDDGTGAKRPLFIDFTLEGEGGTTTLRLVQSGFGADSSFDEEYDGISRGWPIELRSLRLYLERHRGQDRQLAWHSTPVDIPTDDAWRRLTGDGGFRCGEGVQELKEGDAFSFTTADGETFEGTVSLCCEHEFSGIASSHGDAFLRFSVESCGGLEQAWLWLATYGQPASQVEAMQARWERMLTGMFSSSATAAASGS